MPPSTMQRPSLLESLQNPLQALYRYFNVQSTPTPVGSALGPTFDMRVYRDGRMPTHVLAASQPDQDAANSVPLMLPIDRALFDRGFPIDISFPPATPGSSPPVPRSITVPVSASAATGGGGGAPATQQVVVVALPVVTISVPHVQSLALLLLFGMGLETNSNILSWRLLPVTVVEEFPNAAAMSLVLSRDYDEQFESIYRHNQGLWRNILSMGLNNAGILQLVQTAWNVTAEARRIRLRANLFS